MKFTPLTPDYLSSDGGAMFGVVPEKHVAETKSA